MMKRQSLPSTIRIILLYVSFILLLLTFVSGCTTISRSTDIAICGETATGVTVLQASVEATKDGFKISEFERIQTLPHSANSPQQWSLLQYYPLLRRNTDDKHSWFVAGANAGGVGGSVYRFDWRDFDTELWFQLPPGDFVMDIQWTEDHYWQALTIGGDPHCAEVAPGNEYATTKCAMQNGSLYLVDNIGQYQQLVASNGNGRCQASFNSSGTAVAFRESDLCFSFANHEVLSQIHIVDIQDNKTWIVAGDEQKDKPIWSPDGNWIAYEANVVNGPMDSFTDGSIPLRIPQIQAVEVTNHQVHILSSASTNTKCTFVDSSWPLNPWSFDSQKLLWTCSEQITDTYLVHTLEIFNIETYTRHEITRSEQSRYDLWNHAAWSPDSETIVWDATIWEGSDLNIDFTFQTLESGRVRSLKVDSPSNLVWPRWSPDGHVLGLVRTTPEHDYLELFTWPNLELAEVIELPEDADWLDLYWITNE